WIGAITVVATALGMLWKWSGGLRRIAARFEDFADDWQGTAEGPGVPARPGVMERLADFDTGIKSLDRRLTGIEHELHPNSGGSMRDAINRLEEPAGTGRGTSPAIAHRHAAPAARSCRGSVIPAGCAPG